MNRQSSHYVIIESSHLFRAGEKYNTQFFVADVSGFLGREVFELPSPPHTIVLFGSTKNEQADRYVRSLSRSGIEVVRMEPLESRKDASKTFYKPTAYLHGILQEIPRGSTVILVGFHNHRYEEIVRQYSYMHTVHVTAFATKTTKGDFMHIPPHWAELCSSIVELDQYADLIQEEFRKPKE